ncbi:hypothetical protein MJ575_12765 [Klebsiella pneumoniae]|nr:hypothetical protein MJ575_12765 [Klebsiella pneumoniae]
MDASVAVASKRQSPREIFATNDRVTLRFIDAERSFLPNAWCWRVTMSTLRRSVSGKAAEACGLFCVRWTILMWNSAGGECVTTLIEALPDTRLSHATDDRCG